LMGKSGSLPRWQLCRGISGSFRVEWVAGFVWNQWQPWSGIRTVRASTGPPLTLRSTVAAQYWRYPTIRMFALRPYRTTYDAGFRALYIDVSNCQ